MVDDWSSSAAFRDVVIVGGGCYGTFYTGQLLRAAERGRARFRRLLVVDRDPQCRVAREIGATERVTLVVQDWGEFFDRYLADAGSGPESAPGDAIVPSPLMPHLMYEWLVRQARRRWPARTVETTAVPAGPGTPYDVTAPDGTRYVSYADWICPTHCIEPAVCPVIRAPRTWEMADALAAVARKLDRSRPTTGPILFVCEHRVYGVGMFDVAEVVEGDAAVATAGAKGTPIDVLVGTVSSCHGAVNLLHLG
ncbi:MAG TPA: hypothetical protein VKB22_02405 [Gemmatimonadales bacterium]|nr:hypothetical protein [Gemmatimonadales bacterium]